MRAKREGKRPKVSVCVVTYNHEDYIRKCLQSIVDQETDFDFEVLVGEDCSTDGTRKIVCEFAEKYPHRMKAVLYERNCGPVQNFLYVHSVAQGELVCHCDGDDYWLPGKLQAQVTFMEQHPECCMAGHRMYREDDGGQLREDGRGNCDILDSVMDVSAFYKHGNFLAHSSTMYRASSGRVPDASARGIDYLTHIWRVKDGRIGYIKQYLGVYRRHAASVTARMSNSLFHFDINLLALEAIHKIVKDEREFERRKFALCVKCIKNYVANGRIDLAREIALRSRHFILKKRYAAFLRMMLLFGDALSIVVRLKRKYISSVA